MGSVAAFFRPERRRWMWIGAVAMAAAGLVLLAASTRRRVELVVDGERRTIGTYGRSVRAVLWAAGIRVQDGDVIVPEPGSTLPESGVIEVRTARPVTIDVDGRVSLVWTATDFAENILGETGTRIYPGDRVWIDGLPAAALAGAIRVMDRIRVERAFDVVLDDRGARRDFRSAAPTLGEALWDYGVRLRVADQLQPGAGASLAGRTTTRYTPARPVEVDVDGAKVLSWAAGESVGEVLANAGVPLLGMDYAIPAASAPVPLEDPIRVVRVSEGITFEGEVIPFETRWEGSDEIEIDHQGLVDAGSPGLQGVRTRIHYEEGVETERLTEPQWTAVEAHDRIMGYGKKIVVRTLDTPSGPIEYWRAVSMYATAYHPCGSAGEPGKCYYGTASGLPVQKGIAAMTVRNFLAMRGMMLYIPGYGKAQIADTGGGIPGRLWIDLAYPDRESYVSWNRWVTVYFLTPIPPEGAIDYLLD